MVKTARQQPFILFGYIMSAATTSEDKIKYAVEAGGRKAARYNALFTRALVVRIMEGYSNGISRYNGNAQERYIAPCRRLQANQPGRAR